MTQTPLQPATLMPEKDARRDSTVGVKHQTDAEKKELADKAQAQSQNNGNVKI